MCCIQDQIPFLISRRKKEREVENTLRHLSIIKNGIIELMNNVSNILYSIGDRSNIHQIRMLKVFVLSRYDDTIQNINMIRNDPSLSNEFVINSVAQEAVYIGRFNMRIIDILEKMESSFLGPRSRIINV